MTLQPTHLNFLMNEENFVSFFISVLYLHQHRAIWQCVYNHTFTKSLFTNEYTIKYSGARICKPFKEARNRFLAWRVSTATQFVVWSARLHRLANRFLGAINVYKYGLSKYEYFRCGRSIHY
jgi:hypothetical protein